MNDSLERIESIAARARQEKAPQGDVSRLVIRRLRDSGGSLFKPMLVFAAGYAAAASVALVFSITLLNEINDPLTPIFQMASALMP